VILDVHFPRVVYKKLKYISPDFTDMEEASPSVASSLKQLLEYDGDLEHDICRTFEVLSFDRVHIDLLTLPPVVVELCARLCVRVAVCGSNGSILNHATAQMNHKLAHQSAFHQHSIGARLSKPLLKRVDTRTARGFQRATLVCVRQGGFS